MYVKKPKKQCPHNEGVECADEECECCGWNPEGRTKRREPQKRTYTRRVSPKIKDSGAKDKRKRQTNNTSGYTGVYWVSGRNKWSAEIRVGGKRHYLGSFENVEDAIKARKEAEERMPANKN